MYRFKVGDKVRLVNIAAMENHYITLSAYGKLGEVIFVEPKGGERMPYKVYIDLVDDWYWCSDECLEVVNV